jgi:hypothetical protein
MSDDDQNKNGAGPDLLLERVALGEATDEERRALQAKLAERGEDLDERLAELRASDEEILAEYPAEMMAARIDARLDERRKAKEREARRPSRGGWYAGLGVLATAAVAAFLVLNLPGEQNTGPVVAGDQYTDRNGETVRLKGAEPKLIVWRKSGEEPERLKAGATAGEGDVLQLEYNAAGASHGVIASIDGRGVVTLHYPAAADGSTELDDGVVALGHSYELDDAPDFERFFFVTSNESVDVARVTGALDALVASGKARAGQPELPDGTQHTDFAVEKQ